MRKISFLLFIVTLFSAELDAQWSYVGPPDFSVSQADYNSIAIDGSGTPYVAYWDDASSGQFLVQKYNGSAWVNVGSPQWATQFNQAYQEHIKISSAGVPYVFSADYNYGGVKKFANGNWTFVGDSQFTLLRPDYLDMAIAPNGNIFTVYSDYYFNYQPTVRRFSGTNWDTLASRFVTTDQAYYNSIAVDASNNPYIAFSDAGVSDKATVMKFDGTAWSTIGTRGFSAGGANYTNIAINNSGTLYVGYVDVSTGKANVKKFDGTSWIAAGNADFSVPASTLYMALDPSGTPYVAFNQVSDGKVTVMKLSGSTWTLVGSAGFTPFVQTLALAVSPTGVPYVTFSNGTTGQASVMKFGGTSGIADHSADAQVQIYPNPADNMIQITTGDFTPETVTVYDISGQKVIEQSYSSQMNISALSSGMYFIELKNQTINTTQRFTKM